MGAAAGGALEAGERGGCGPAAPVQLEPAGAAQAAAGVGVRGVPGGAPGGGRAGAPALRAPLPLVLRRALGPGRLALPRLPRPGPPRPQLTGLPRDGLAARWPAGRGVFSSSSAGRSKAGERVTAPPPCVARPGHGHGRMAVAGRLRVAVRARDGSCGGHSRVVRVRDRSGSDDGARRDGALSAWSRCDRTGRQFPFTCAAVLLPTTSMDHSWSHVLISLLG